MNHDTATRILRFDRLEKQARIYYTSGQQRGNAARMLRAARLEQAAYNKALFIVLAEVTP